MIIKTEFTQQLNLEFPVIMAPMFLVSNEAMIESAMRSGIAGVFPSLNYRKENELGDLLKRLNSYKNNTSGTYGVNLIVQKTNPLYEKHLEVCVMHKVPFYITSLGSPKQVVKEAHRYGAKVYCDVTNTEHAAKAAEAGCDGFIAVGQGAGGHAGPYPNSLLIPTLKKQFPEMPVIAAGTVTTGSGILSMLSLGAAGISIGTRFIASKEATVTEAYKNSVLNSGMKDVVLTERLSGTPCNIINTPYAKKIGYHQNFLERWLSNNATTKRYFKMLIQFRGLKKLEDAVKPGNYNNLWCAGQTVELIDDILTCDEIIKRLKDETLQAKTELDKIFH
ncbi:MAG: nitronate monooxygenase [Bacteroidetes bacterium]|jgi:nitronate monooxygenase|nr:nitronate monooxygenase [Bacteroidota bacterium]